MDAYYGDISGYLLWEFYKGDVKTSYLQNPFDLLCYGATHRHTCVWDGCECLVQDNNHTFCWECYETREQQKSYSNLDDLKKTIDDLLITRENYEQMIPWIREYGPSIDRDLVEMTFEWDSGTVVSYGNYHAPTGENQNLLGIFVLMKQIGYFFETCEKDQCVLYFFNTY